MNPWIIVSFILFSVIVAGLVWYFYFNPQTSTSTTTPSPTPAASFSITQLATSARVTVLSPGAGYILVLQPSLGSITYSGTFSANTTINVQNLQPMTAYTVILIDSNYKLVGTQSFTTMTQPVSAPQPSPRTPGPI